MKKEDDEGVEIRSDDESTEIVIRISWDRIGQITLFLILVGLIIKAIAGGN